MSISLRVSNSLDTIQVPRFCHAHKSKLFAETLVGSKTIDNALTPSIPTSVVCREHSTKFGLNKMLSLIWIQTDALMVFLKEFLEKVDFEKKSADKKKHSKFTSRQRVKKLIPLSASTVLPAKRDSDVKYCLQSY